MDLLFCLGPWDVVLAADIGACHFLSFSPLTPLNAVAVPYFRHFPGLVKTLCGLCSATTQIILVRCCHSFFLFVSDKWRRRTKKGTWSKKSSSLPWKRRDSSSRCALVLIPCPFYLI